MTEKIQEGLEEHQIPMHMREGLTAYIIDGRPTGHFLRAVLTNDLKDAVARADDENQPMLVEYVKFLYNYAPLGCWGSESVVERWIALGGLNGRNAEVQNA